MTDAALPLTGTAVESFVERYLTALGATIDKQDQHRWYVSTPNDIDTALDLDGATLKIPQEGEELDEDENHVIAPESQFVQRILDEAAERKPLGRMELLSDEVEPRPPAWLATDETEILDTRFAPYYDRSALCGLFHVGIETVSEFEREELYAIAIDASSGNRLDGLEQTYIDLTERDDTSVMREGTVDLSANEEWIEQAFDEAEEQVRPVVRETREKATRAANVELSEYQQYQQDRLGEFSSEAERLSERVDEANRTIDSADNQQQRMEALRSRKELRAELEEVEAKRDEIAAELDAGFPEKRRNVRERHSISVRLRPVALTEVTFERGELTVTITGDEGRGELTLPFALGVGQTEEVPCASCGTTLHESNPPIPVGGEVVGENCCR